MLHSSQSSGTTSFASEGVGTETDDVWTGVSFLHAVVVPVDGSRGVGRE